MLHGYVAVLGIGFVVQEPVAFVRALGNGDIGKGGNALAVEQGGSMFGQNRCGEGLQHHALASGDVVARCEVHMQLTKIGQGL